MADRSGSKEAASEEERRSEDSAAPRPFASGFELTLFGKGAVGAAAVALLAEAALVAGVELEAWCKDARLWHCFLWRLALALTCLRLMVVVSSKLGAHLVSQSSSVFVEFLMAPSGPQGHGASRWRKAVAGMVISKSAKPGGAWDIDSQIMHMLMNEAEGISSGIWILGAVLLAAVWSGLPLMTHFTAIPHLVMAMLAWRFACLCVGAVSIVCHQVMDHSSIPVDSESVRGVFRFLDVFVVLLTILFVLSNLGCNVSAALTGLGVTSMLVGLSSQAVLKDFFSWLIIVTQKPFICGDFCSFRGSPNGTVESINFLTTSLRIPAGELMVFSNQSITDGQVVNHASSKNRRFDLSFEVTALCPAELLAEVPEIVKGAVGAQAKCNFVNCWIEAAVPLGFQFNYQFFAEMPDIQEARSASTAIWLRMLSAFEDRKIVLASADRLRRGCVLQAT